MYDTCFVFNFQVRKFCALCAVVRLEMKINGVERWKKKGFCKEAKVQKCNKWLWRPRSNFLTSLQHMTWVHIIAQSQRVTLSNFPTLWLPINILQSNPLCLHKQKCTFEINCRNSRWGIFKPCQMRRQFDFWIWCTSNNLTVCKRGANFRAPS